MPNPPVYPVICWACLLVYWEGCAAPSALVETFCVYTVTSWAGLPSVNTSCLVIRQNYSLRCQSPAVAETRTIVSSSRYPWQELENRITSSNGTNQTMIFSSILGFRDNTILYTSSISYHIKLSTWSNPNISVVPRRFILSWLLRDFSIVIFLYYN